ncbi:hypothetical protein EXIGLDRAFT_797020 [Exidia glandulosa HHB12029]|uniref:Uncharacterized protein n=1 Tax=Exidia glandulosa HHB12029 TaxID=1314781 RepID=A0A165N9W1_EXIGL|nr:hypothetical protein EXIGLDRAFT_797020 [Exidia glandulosa HHB12029]
MNHFGASLPLSPVSAQGPSLFPLPPSRPPSPQEDAPTSQTQTPPSYPQPVSLLLDLMAMLGSSMPDTTPSFSVTRDGAIVRCLKRQYGMLSGTTTPRSDAVHCKVSPSNLAPQTDGLHLQAEDSEESVLSDKDGISLDGRSLSETGTIGSTTAPHTTCNHCNARHPSKQDCGGTTDGSDGHDGLRSALQEGDGDEIYAASLQRNIPTTSPANKSLDPVGHDHPMYGERERGGQRPSPTLASVLIPRRRAVLRRCHVRASNAHVVLARLQAALTPVSSLCRAVRDAYGYLCLCPTRLHGEDDADAGRAFIQAHP